jgi:hypothetical protein
MPDEPTQDPEVEQPQSAGTEDEVTVPDGAENPDAVRAALKRERDAAKQAKQQAAELAARLQEYEDRDKSESEKLAERAAKLEQDLADREREFLRLKVATSKGLPPEIAEFLNGSSEEELEQQADRLLALSKEHAPDPVSFDGGARDSQEPPKPAEESHNDFLMRALGRN